MLALLMATGSALAQSDGGSRKSEKAKPFVVAEQGRFAVGGTVRPNGGTFDPIGLALNLNNLKVADLLPRYLKEKGLDRH